MSIPTGFTEAKLGVQSLFHEAMDPRILNHAKASHFLMTIHVLKDVLMIKVVLPSFP